MVYINRKIQNLISNFPKELHRGFLSEMCKMSKEEGMRIIIYIIQMILNLKILNPIHLTVMSSTRTIKCK